MTAATVLSAIAAQAPARTLSVQIPLLMWRRVAWKRNCFDSKIYPVPAYRASASRWARACWFTCRGAGGASRVVYAS